MAGTGSDALGIGRMRSLRACFISLRSQKIGRGAVEGVLEGFKRVLGVGEVSLRGV